MSTKTKGNPMDARGRLQGVRRRGAVLLAVVAALTISGRPGYGQNIPASQPSVEGVNYLGKPQTAEWLEAQYKKFGDKIGMVDCKYYNAPQNAPLVDVDPPNIGDFRLTPERSKVFQVLEDNGVLIVRPAVRAQQPAPSRLKPGRTYSPDDYSRRMQEDILRGGTNEPTKSEPQLLFRVTGANTNKTVVDGMAFESRLLLFTGTFQYRNGLGVQQTVQSFNLVQPLTKEQFAKALAAGLKLPGVPDVETSGPPAATTRPTLENAQAAVDGLTAQLKKLDADSAKVAEYVKLQGDIAMHEPYPQFAEQVAAAKERLKTLGNITPADVNAYKEGRAKLENLLDEAKKALRGSGS